MRPNYVLIVSARLRGTLQNQHFPARLHYFVIYGSADRQPAHRRRYRIIPLQPVHDDWAARVHLANTAEIVLYGAVDEQFIVDQKEDLYSRFSKIVTAETSCYHAPVVQRNLAEHLDFPWW